MFTYTSSIDGKTQEFPNRDALLLGLESEENRCLQMNITTELTLQQVDQEGNILDQTKLVFPMPEGTNYQEALANFGLQAEPRKGLLSGLLPGGDSKSSNLPAKHSQGKTVRQEPAAPRKSPFSFLVTMLKGTVIGLALLLGLLSFFISTENAKKLRAAKTGTGQPKSSQTVQVNAFDEHGVDVFSRYFLGAYFNQTDEIKTYAAPDIDKAKLKTDIKTPTSVLMESIKAKDGKYTVTYVCGLKDDSGKVSTERVTFTVKDDKSSDYGYQVTTAPKLSAYPS
ncbi:hypothetical protein ACVR0A_06705 [Streptococcus downei]|uniref:Uncharacterized protein n=1 Tax=Streptococcus downei MFe28 TaxID=764290 RepID=A0A380JGH8_STRDO|nr:hypothetical protein [Streptococcus downei]SUN37173.1 Uncharacterised protein [Streptococcus downei MFe28]